MITHRSADAQGGTSMTTSNNKPSISGNHGGDGDLRSVGAPIAPPMYDIFLKSQDNYTIDDVEISNIFRDQLHIFHPGKVRFLVESLRMGSDTICATRTREVAETKMTELNAMFRSASCPLYCTIRQSEHYGV